MYSVAYLTFLKKGTRKFANYKENLSYHMARHSFGTLTLTAGIPIESIARMMGHTNIDSTQVYAQVTDRKISSDMNRLMERRKPAAGKEAAG